MENPFDGIKSIIFPICIYADGKSKTKDERLEFNTYCIFTQDKKDISETIALIFKDYIESLKLK